MAFRSLNMQDVEGMFANMDPAELPAELQQLLSRLRPKPVTVDTTDYAKKILESIKAEKALRAEAGRINQEMEAMEEEVGKKFEEALPKLKAMKPEEARVEAQKMQEQLFAPMQQKQDEFEALKGAFEQKYGREINFTTRLAATLAKLKPYAQALYEATRPASLAGVSLFSATDKDPDTKWVRDEAQATWTNTKPRM